MNRNIYRSDQGRELFEKYYTDILSCYKDYPYEELYIDTDIAKTHVLKFGDSIKPPLFMFHGSTSNSATWLGSILYFINDFTIYCVDIPGEPGLSEPVRCELNTDEPLKWIESLLDNMKIGKAFLLGMSLGTWYAMNFMINRPNKVHALSMITAGGFAPMKKSFIFKVLFASILGDNGKKAMNNAIYYKTAVPDEVIAFQSLAAAHFNPLMEPLPIFTDDQIRNISVPLQFFGGDHDSLIDSVRTAKRIKTYYPSADVHILEDTGHVILDQFENIFSFFKKTII